MKNRGKNRKFSQEEKLTILKLSKMNIRYEDISKMFCVSPGKVSNFLKENGIKKDNYRKYTLNSKYFEKVDSKDKAYFLGLMVSDGYNSGKRISIGLEEQDKYILQLFSSYMEYKGNLIFVNKTEKAKAYSKLDISCPTLCRDLENLGVVPKKSNKTYFPPIQEEFYSHFIRGVFDGDGCICLPKNGKKSLNFSIFGNFDLINRIQDILIKNCELNKTKFYIAKNCSSSNFGSIRYVGTKQVIKIYNFLYKDCGNLFLTRKKEKFENIQNKLKLGN